jgi:protocatechuate 3,4-dioxygenase beta subunit
MSEPSSHRLTRRDALTWMGAGALTVVAAACGKSSRTTANPTPTSPGGAPAITAAGGTATAAGSSTGAACVLMPELTEGPYYIAGESIRRDITEGRPGTPLQLDLAVVDATTCAPISGATVEVWHADAAGDYSGFGNGASSRTFLRGGQKTDGTGKATFATIYPGWYQGRAVHIHVKVNDGSRTHAGQLFFDDAVSESVYATAPYTGHSGQWLRTSQDGIYRGGGSRSTLAMTRQGTGYVGALTLAVQRA